MKKLISLIFVGLLVQSNEAQSINLKELTTLSELSPEKLEVQLRKKGFIKAGSNKNNAFSFLHPGQMQSDSQQVQHPYQYFHINREGARIETVYQTSSYNDYQMLEKELEMAGYKYQPISANNSNLLFQKENRSFERADKQIDSVQYYGFKMHIAKIPKSKNFPYLEDLFEFNSHELLSTLFGKQNVKSDVFRLSEMATIKCTVIFPNTDRQAIFLWEDEVNLRSIYSIIIGEQSAGTVENMNQVTMSSWRSREGVYCGMSLKDLEQRNGAPINFYNWPTDQAGVLFSNSNSGTLNFNKIKMALSCMNCHFVYVNKTEDIISSTYALQQNQRVYVSTIVIFP